MFRLLRQTITHLIIRVKSNLNVRLGGVVASWLLHLPLDRAVWVLALAGDIVLCSWARHFTLTVPLSTQVYKWGSRNTPCRFMLLKLELFHMQTYLILQILLLTLLPLLHCFSNRRTLVADSTGIHKTS